MTACSSTELSEIVMLTEVRRVLYTQADTEKKLTSSSGQSSWEILENEKLKWPVLVIFC